MARNYYCTKETYLHQAPVKCATYNRIKDNLTTSEVLIKVDYSENFHNKQQQKIQSAYFGNTSLSIFTACVCYRQEVQKMQMTTTTAISCVDTVIKHVE